MRKTRKLPAHGPSFSISSENFLPQPEINMALGIINTLFAAGVLYLAYAAVNLVN